MDRNKPVTNPELVRAMEAYLQNADDNNADKMLEQIVMHAQFLIPAGGFPADSTGTGEMTIEKDTTVQFHLISRQNGEQFFLAFTDWDELRKWKNAPDMQTVVLRFDDYAAMLEKSPHITGIAINPMSHSITLNRRLITALAEQKKLRGQGLTAQKGSAGDKVAVGDAKTPPVELLTRLSAHLAQDARVEKAYLRMMQRDKRTSYLVIVDCEGDRVEVFGAISAALRGVQTEYPVDIADYSDSFGQAAAEGAVPIYARQDAARPVS